MKIRLRGETETGIEEVVRKWATRTTQIDGEIEARIEYAVLMHREEVAGQACTWNPVHEDFLQDSAYRKHEALEKRLREAGDDFLNRFFVAPPDDWAFYSLANERWEESMAIADEVEEVTDLLHEYNEKHGSPYGDDAELCTVGN